jgi:hypothetical protein
LEAGKQFVFWKMIFDHCSLVSSDSSLFLLLRVNSLIPAAIGANAAMLKTLSGKKETVDVDAGKSGESFDPTINETKYRAYVESGVGADGPILPFSSLLFATEPVKLVDIIAIVS